VATLLHEAGYAVVAVSDVLGGVYDPDGLDIPALVRAKKSGLGVRDVYSRSTVTTVERAESISNADLLELDVDVLIPAAIESQITVENAKRVRASVVLSGVVGGTRGWGRCEPGYKR
jgi:glutamate dehydrogenase (NADP+)